MLHRDCTHSDGLCCCLDKLAVYFSRLSGALSALSIRSVMSDGLSLYCPGLTGEEVEVSMCEYSGMRWIIVHVDGGPLVRENH